MMRMFKMYFLAIFQIYNTVFTIVTMLYISSPIHFIIQIYTFWLPLPAPNPPLLATTIYSASLNLFFLNITHINEIICYFSFSVWFVSLDIMPSRSIHIVATGKIFFFFMVGYKSILHFLYPFISEDLHCLTHIYCYKILKGNTVKVLQSIRQQIWKIHQWPQDWRRSVFI